MCSWTIYCLGGIEGEIWNQYLGFSQDMQRQIRASIIDMKDKEDWTDDELMGEGTYKDLGPRDSDDCKGLGRIEVRLKNHVSRVSRKWDHVAKIIGIPDHEDRTFLILGFKMRPFIRGRSDKKFYQKFCSESKRRHADSKEINDHAEVF